MFPFCLMHAVSREIKAFHYSVSAQMSENQGEFLLNVFFAQPANNEHFSQQHACQTQGYFHVLQLHISSSKQHVWYQMREGKADVTIDALISFSVTK